MATRLSSLDDILAPVLAGILPVDAEIMPLAAALGAFAAEDINAPHALPQQATALVAGYAVSSDDTLGASAHEPMPLAVAVSISAGMAIPAGTNAIAQADLIEVSGGIFHILGSVSPGDGVRFAGHDLAAGAKIIGACERINPQHLAVLDALGVDAIAARRPRIALEGGGPARLWLERVLAGLGALIVPDHAHLSIALHDDLPDSLALAPGQGTRISRSNGTVMLDCPARIEGAVAAFFAVALPILAKLSGASITHQTHALSRGVRSAIGLSEVALFRRSDEGSAEPLICGQITLEALLAASHLAIVPPDREGYPAGTRLPMIPIAEPL
jgi:molybdopterin molybdotransferase